MAYIENGEIVLNSGRKFEAYGGIIGIKADGSDDIFYGYDGAIATGAIGSEDDEDMTLPERIEVAELMVEAWSERLRRWKSMAAAT